MNLVTGYCPKNRAVVMHQKADLLGQIAAEQVGAGDGRQHAHAATDRVPHKHHIVRQAQGVAHVQHVLRVAVQAAVAHRVEGA